MATVTIMPSGKTIEAEVGKTLLETVIAAGEKLKHECDGNSECGSCHLFVQAGRKSVSRIQPIENQKLDTMVGIGSKSRLACQARIIGDEDITIELLGFASGF
ncbi:2Fe-2S iron-sulfur cluster-binding protein [Methylolobus aquaticus]